MEELYTINEVCKILKITRTCIYKWEKLGKIKIVRMNGIPRISRKEVERIMKGE